MSNKNIIKVMVALVCLSGLFYCGCKNIEPQGEILATINGYVLTVDQFKQEIAHSPYATSSVVNKKDLVDLIIYRELLIQEAQRQGLDRNDDFMRSIERYWKQTLVKEVLKSENQRLGKSTNDQTARDALEGWIEDLRKDADICVKEEVLKTIEN